MVRLVFRPYTQVWRSICTSEPLRTSTRVSSGFILLRHSSPSFGSQRVRSFAATLQCNCDRTVLRQTINWSGSHLSHREVTFTFISPLGFVWPNDLRTCWTPWSVFQDGSGRLTTIRLRLKCHWDLASNEYLTRAHSLGSNAPIQTLKWILVSRALTFIDAVHDHHVHISSRFISPQKYHGT